MPHKAIGPGDASPLMGEGHDCERCFEPATFVVQDVRCVGFRYSNAQDVYFTDWHREGPPHFFCRKHKRRSREFDREVVGRRFVLEHPERCREATLAEVARARTEDARRERC